MLCVSGSVLTPFRNWHDMCRNLAGISRTPPPHLSVFREMLPHPSQGQRCKGSWRSFSPFICPLSFVAPVPHLKQLREPTAPESVECCVFSYFTIKQEWVTTRAIKHFELQSPQMPLLHQIVQNRRRQQNRYKCNLIYPTIKRPQHTYTPKKILICSFFISEHAEYISVLKKYKMTIN